MCEIVKSWPFFSSRFNTNKCSTDGAFDRFVGVRAFRVRSLVFVRSPTSLNAGALLRRARSIPADLSTSCFAWSMQLPARMRASAAQSTSPRRTLVAASCASASMLSRDVRKVHRRRRRRPLVWARANRQVTCAVRLSPSVATALVQLAICESRGAGASSSGLTTNLGDKSPGQVTSRPRRWLGPLNNCSSADDETHLRCVHDEAGAKKLHPEGSAHMSDSGSLNVSSNKPP